MIKLISSLLLYIMLSVSVSAGADGSSAAHTYGSDYGLSHTYGYFIQKRAAAAPASSANARPNSPQPLFSRQGQPSSGYDSATDKETRLRALEKDDKTGSADRGWIRQEVNRVDKNRAANPNLIYGNSSHPAANTLRNPPGKILVPGLRSDAGVSGYGQGRLQQTPLHALSHSHDNNR